MASTKQIDYIKSMVSNLQNAPYLKTAPDSNKKRWMEDVMRLPSYDEDDKSIRRPLEEVQLEFNNRCDKLLNADLSILSTTEASKLIDSLKSKYLPSVNI